MNWNSFLLVGSGLVLGAALCLMLTPLAVNGGASPHIALWLELTNRVCTSIGGLGTFAAMIFVVRQFQLLRLQTELLQKNIIASMDSALYQRLDSFNRFIIEHHKIYDLLKTQVNGHEPAEQQAKLHHLCDLGFTFYEELFKHHARYQLLQAEDWEQWKAKLIHFFGKPYVQGYWRIVSPRYSQNFQKFINDMYEAVSIKIAA